MSQLLCEWSRMSKTPKRADVWADAIAKHGGPAIGRNEAERGGDNSKAVVNKRTSSISISSSENVQHQQQRHELQPHQRTLQRRSEHLYAPNNIQGLTGEGRYLVDVSGRDGPTHAVSCHQI